MPGARRWSSTRSYPAGIRVRRSCHHDVRHGLWHHVRCREIKICGLRPGPDTGKPQAARKLLRFPLFLRTPSDQLQRGTGATHAERRAGCRRGNSIRLRPRLASLHSPEVGFWIDGAMPFRGETTKGYVTGLLLRYAQDLVTSALAPIPYPTSMLGASISKTASATTRLSKASSPWFRASL